MSDVGAKHCACFEPKANSFVPLPDSSPLDCWYRRRVLRSPPWGMTPPHASSIAGCDEIMELSWKNHDSDHVTMRADSFDTFWRLAVHSVIPVWYLGEIGNGKQLLQLAHQAGDQSLQRRVKLCAVLNREHFLRRKKKPTRELPSEIWEG